MTGTELNREDLSKKIQLILADILDVPQEDVPIEKDLIDSLNIDSIMQLQILMVLERTFKLTLDMNDLKRMKSVSDMCDVLLEKGIPA
jgi:acyl carrier protein